MPSLTRAGRNRQEIAGRYIRSLNPSLYLPLWKRNGVILTSDDACGHQATVTGSCPWTERGRFFVGSGTIVINIPDSPYLMPASDFSLVCWFKTSGITAASYAVLVKKLTVATESLFYIDTTTQILRFESGDGVHFPEVVSPVAVNDNIWHFAVGVKDRTAGKLYLYLDDYLVQSATDNTTSIANTGNFAIGALTAGNSRQFLGTIGEIILTQRVLVPTEVMTLWNLTKWRYQ